MCILGQSDCRVAPGRVICRPLVSCASRAGPAHGAPEGPESSPLVACRSLGTPVMCSL